MIKVLATVGLQLTEEQCATTTGLRFDHVLEYWFEKYPWTHKSIIDVHEEVLVVPCCRSATPIPDFDTALGRGAAGPTQQPRRVARMRRGRRRGSTNPTLLPKALLASGGHAVLIDC